MTIRSEPIELAYSEIGSGPPLVLLHGLGGGQDNWQLQVPALAPRYRLILPDLRGHGRSPKPKGPYRMEQMAADVAKLLRRLEAWPAHVLGLSLGGAVALQLALDEPRLVRSLVLVNTLPKFATADWRQRMLGVRRFVAAYVLGMDRIAEQVAGRLFPKPEQGLLRAEAAAHLARNDLAAYRASLWAVARFDVTPRLSKIACPALVIAGDQDTTLPLEPKRRLAEQIPGARLLVVPNSGHATPLDQPEAFNAAVLGFLAQIEGGS
ncbi:MAG: alpha/beta hydrolase [Caldilineales bacterium]|nr:alpha/beta hydrolase [Caldilineales bacterium]MDW8319118.1 alpha/beta hydrolase [Anaerolineae bacterium]